MRLHHTKNKGDLGVLHAKVDLAEKGFDLFWPLTEHQAFDLVAYRYRTSINGVISVKFHSSWADRHGVHTVLMDKDSVDVVCIYCPDTRRCYYIDPRRHGISVQLRVAPTRNHQAKGVLFADAFTEFPETP